MTVVQEFALNDVWFVFFFLRLIADYTVFTTEVKNCK